MSAALQLFLLGMMVAWTPSLVFLTFALLRTPETALSAGPVGI